MDTPTCPEELGRAPPGEIHLEAPRVVCRPALRQAPVQACAHAHTAARGACVSAGARHRPPATALSYGTCSLDRSNSSPSHGGCLTTAQTQIANVLVGIRRNVLTGMETLFESGFNSPKWFTF